MIPQFWLWGVDAANGDLTASGFVRRERPIGTGSRSSLYVRDDPRNGELWLHANGLWLAELSLLYHRGQERFYRTDTAYFAAAPPVWLEPFSFTDGLGILRPIITDHERLIVDRRGCEYCSRLLETPAPFGVRLAWSSWCDWLEVDTAFVDHTLMVSQQVFRPA